MTVISLRSASFPALADMVRARWAPVLISPIAGSWDRLVIGVAVANSTGFYVKPANSLARLRCLYGEQAEAAIFASVVALEHLADAFAIHGEGAFESGAPAISLVSIGPPSEGEGRTLEDIASNWLSMLSSLHQADRIEADEGDAVEGDRASDGDGIDRLPRLVMDYVSRQRPDFSRFFRQDLIGAQRRRKNHEVTIDFSGPRLVANFGILQPKSIAKSVDHIKRRLWDLKVDREKEAGALLVRSHEMIVQMPACDDPMFTTRQHARLRDAHEALEEQADQQQMRLRPLPSVERIAQRVIDAETAALA